jgi:pimeloyl-ACP methyl ester carboxylesterase
MALTARVLAWRERGRSEEFRDRRIHVFGRGGRGPLLLLLHGFPSSSYDWRILLDEERERAVLAPDLLGFGLSEKPRDHDYTLNWQADLVEELVRRHSDELVEGAGTDAPVFIVAHDMGTSVATELLARDLEGRLEMNLAGVLLFNGSMVQGAASPTLAQRILRSPLGPVVSRLSSERFFRAQFGSIFSPGHPLRDEEAEDQWSLICAGGGRTIAHKTIRYMDERYRHAERWHGALRDWPGRLQLAWGMEDPVATTAVLSAVRELRPQAPLAELPGLGHYPQIEDPPRLNAVLQRALDA